MEVVGLGGQHTCQSLSCLQSFLKLLRSEISLTREMRSRMFPGALGSVDTPGGIQSEWNVPPDRLLDKFPVMLPNQPVITSSRQLHPQSGSVASHGLQHHIQCGRSPGWYHLVICLCGPTRGHRPCQPCASPAHCSTQ